MRVVTATAEVMGAAQLLDVTGAHIDSCLYHGRAGLDFAERLLAGDGRVAVPTTLNVSSLDLLHPDLYRGDAETATLGRRLMECYTEMGGRPTWTCAPYQLPERPGRGEHVAWAESNAIVFANSVLGARTNRYGDFIDICAAITGRAPAAGLHLDDPRLATVQLRLTGLPDRLLAADVFYPVLGHLMGVLAGTRVTVVDGLPPRVGEDRLKAVGAAAASSGAVAMFHAVGSTPEAPDLETALGGRDPAATVEVDPALVAMARDELTTATGDSVHAVSLGTPHYSPVEIEAVAAALDGRRVHPDVQLFVNTGRDVLAAVPGAVIAIESAGGRFVVDTCTYITPIIDTPPGSVVMTDSGKWAYYAPGNLGVDVVFGSRGEAIESAVAGRLVRDEELWAGV